MAKGEYLTMLNRDLLIVRYKQPFVHWIHEADPHPDGRLMTLKEINDGSPTYIVHEYASEDLENWLRECYLPLFENILKFVDSLHNSLRLQLSKLSPQFIWQ